VLNLWYYSFVLRGACFNEGIKGKNLHLNVMVCWRWSQEKGPETLLYIHPLARRTSLLSYNALASSWKFKYYCCVCNPNGSWSARTIRSIRVMSYAYDLTRAWEIGRGD